MPVVDFDFVFRFLNITLMDLAPSGDNAIVIGMAASSLPHNRRRWAIVIGGLLAIALPSAILFLCRLSGRDGDSRPR